MHLRASFLLLSSLVLVSPFSVLAQAREWTSSDGRKLSGLLLGTTGSTVSLKTAAGAVSVIPLEKLCVADRDFIAEWRKSRSPELALPPAIWPSEISVGTIKLDGPANGNEGWVITTQHQEILCEEELARGAVLDLATVGEATYSWLHAWPVAFPKRNPAELNRVRIFKNRSNFESAGGGKETAGVYKPGERGELQMPFESIGIESSPDSTTFRKGNDYSPKVLIHEMAHQQMSECLFLLPMWLQEGMAEYAALPAYRAGRFVTTREAMVTRLKLHLEDYETRQPDTGAKSANGQRYPMNEWILPLRQLLDDRVTDALWNNGSLADKHRLYLTSLLTTFYFLQLEGDGQGRRFRIYWEDVLAARLFHVSHGSEGSIPEGAERNRHSITRLLAAKFLAPQSPDALQADMVKRFGTLGIRIAFPAGK